MTSAKVAIGFITYGEATLKYLPEFTKSLAQQTWQDFSVLVWDNSPAGDDANELWLKQNCPSAQIRRNGKNLGFAAGYNLLIEAARAAGAEYFVVTNPDTYWQPRALELLVKPLSADANLGSVSPKVLRWDFVQQKFTDLIDTCGLELLAGLRFADIGQGQVDKGQYDNASILGPSGCAGLFRLSALEQIKFDGKQYFDEHFFMYKEDCDLAYRLCLAKLPSALAPEAIVYHDRSVAEGGRSNLAIAFNRRRKSLQTRRWSFANQQYIFKKYWRRQNFWNKANIIWYEIKIFAFVLLFERELLAGHKK